jgi:hypothetical protein
MPNDILYYTSLVLTMLVGYLATDCIILRKKLKKLKAVEQNWNTIVAIRKAQVLYNKSKLEDQP